MTEWREQHPEHTDHEAWYSISRNNTDPSTLKKLIRHLARWWKRIQRKSYRAYVVGLFNAEIH